MSSNTTLPARSTSVAQPSRTLLLNLLLLLHFTTVQVFASVYPTQPIANTVYTSGQPAHISWKDDGEIPHISALGLMQIELDASTLTLQGLETFHVKTLAKDVPPITRSCTVLFPFYLPSNASSYILRFVLPTSSSHPHTPTTIYTADFHIKPPQGADPGPTNDPYPVSSLLLPQSPLVGPTTPVSTPTPTRGIVSATTITADPLDDGIAAAGPGDGNQKDAQAQTKKVSADGSRNRNKMEQMKFRLVFVLWPALFGVSMAI